MTTAIAHLNVPDTRRFALPVDRVITAGAGALIMIAAILKLIEALLYSETAKVTILEQYSMVVATVELILGLGILSCAMFVPNARKLVCLTTTCLFIAFLGFASHRLVSGLADCGCFGLLKVPPWVTVVLDAGIIVALIVTGRLLKSSTLRALALPCLGIGLAAGAMNVTFAGPCVIRVENLVGQRLEVDSDATDVWVFDPNCDKCKWVHVFTRPERSLLVSYARLGLLMPSRSSQTQPCIVLGSGVQRLSVDKTGYVRSVKIVSQHEQ